MPVPGWTGEYDWTGLLSFEANPSVLDPPGGVIINANDRPSPDPRSAGYAGEWDPGFRAAYIAQRLAPLAKADLADMRALQTDTTSPPVARFREALLAGAPSTPPARDAQRLVAGWDGGLAADSAAAAIYETWLVRMLERTFKERLGSLYTDYLEKGRALFALYQLVGRPNDPWFSSAGDASSGGRDALSGRALDDAVGDLRARLGNDLRTWRWGALHAIAFEHPLAIGPLALLFNIGPVARPGDSFSVNNGGYQVARPYRLSNHASERMIADLADLDRSLSITPEGESGQPLSAHWADQTRLWDAGDYKPMRFSRDQLGRLEGTLVFRPR